MVANGKNATKLSMPYFIYIVRCSDNSLYTGYTNDVEKRIKKHNDGKGAKYTKHRLPVYVVHIEKFETKSDALKREHQIKKLNKKEKEELCIVIDKKLV